MGTRGEEISHAIHLPGPGWLAEAKRDQDEDGETIHLVAGGGGGV